MAGAERTQGTSVPDVPSPTPREMAEALARLGKAGRPPAQRASSEDTGGTGSGGSSPVSS